MAAIYLTYSSFTQLLNSVMVLSEPNHKLVKLQHTLADIATAESSIRAYTLTTQEKHFKLYLRNHNTIQQQIDTLRRLMATSPLELQQVDSIAVLLQTKQKSMQKYVALKKQRNSHSYSDKAMRQIMTTAATPPATTTVTEQTTTTISDQLLSREVSPEPQEEKRGLFNRIFSRKQEKPAAPKPLVIPQISVTKEISVDSTTTAQEGVTDISDVKRILSKVQREVNRYEDMLISKELALLQQDKQIMDQIRGMIYDLEKREQHLTETNALQARDMAKDTSLTLLLVGIAGLLSSVAFILLILRDITRSNRYKVQLIRARKEAVQLARAKETFVANMSHEIRTPLNVVLGFTEQLQQTPLEADQQEHLQAVYGAGRHLLHIVNNVLDLSKMEAGKLQISIGILHLSQLLQEVEQAFRLKAEAKGIAFSCRLQEQLAQPLLGDAVRLKQVLFNLVDNAIKFTHTGEVRVVCSLKTARRNRMVVSIAVSDTGIGIPEEQTEHVFGEFNQADASTVRKYGGTGLGLPISKRLVEMHGGSLKLQSNPGHGTTFTIMLPLHKPRVLPAPAPAAPVFRTDNLQGKRILVVEDDAYSRSLCELILQPWGVRVYLADDGQEALQLMEEYTFDLVLTDIQLPGISGKAVARAIHKKYPHLPVIALTANVMSSSKGFFKGTNISDYLLKPYTGQELLQKVSAALQPGIAPSAEKSMTIPAPMAQDTTPLYDLSEIKLFAAANPDALRGILKVLTTDHRQNLRLLEAAAEAQDWQQVGEGAHKMLTAFKHLKAQTVVPYLIRLEQLLHQPDLEKQQVVQELLPLLKNKAIPVLDELEREMEKLKPAGELVV